MLKTKDGLDLFIQSWKVADPKAIIVLTHGYNDHSSRFAHVGSILNQAGCSLYAYDLRGHGKSGGPRGHAPNFEDFLDDLALVIAAAQQDQAGKKVFGYGHNLGGNITLNYALRRPEGGLSGVMVTGPWLKLAFELPALQVAIFRLIGSFAPGFSQKVKMDATRMSCDLAAQEAYQADPLLHCRMSARLFAEVTAGGLYALERARFLKLPVLLMHGADDQVTSAAATQLFFNGARAADRTIKFYAGMRHEIHNEVDKEEVFEDMAAWLEKQSKPQREGQI